MDNESNMTEADFYHLNPNGIKAYDNHVILSIAKPKKETETGIVIPGKGLEGEPGVGTVISIGHGVERLKLGNKVQWKDSITFAANSQKVTNDSGVFVDMKNYLVAVRKDMIIAIKG
jgi:co-chaperonin GroES (HSP10)